jgi:hypothetical protein
MKAISIACLSTLLFCSLAAVEPAEMDQCTQLKKLAEWREARTGEAMLNLISFAKNEEIPVKIRAVAVLDLNQGYLPADEMREWAGKNFLEEEDLVAFAMASSEQDHARWSEFIQTSVSERKTKKYQLKIYLNDVQYIDGTGLKRMGKDERLSLIQSRLHEVSPEAKIDRVEYETVMDGFLMIAYGYYTDESGDERLIALLDSERFRKDQRIDPDGGINSVTSLRDSTP